MEMQVLAEYSKEGIELLNRGVLKLGKGGLRWADGPNKGHLYELAKHVLVPSEKDGGQVTNTLQKIAENCSALQKQGSGALQQLDRMSGKMNLMAGLDIANAVFSVADLAVDIAGFYIVCKKLDNLDAEVRGLADKLDSLNQKAELYRSRDIITEMKKDLSNFSECKTQADRVAYYTSNKRDIDVLLGHVEDRLFEIVYAFESAAATNENRAAACNMLSLMLFLYCNELYEVNECYFYKEQKAYPQFETQLGIFDELCGSTFQDALKEYLVFSSPELSPEIKARSKESMNSFIFDKLFMLITTEQLHKEMIDQGVTSEEDLLLQPLDATLSTEQIQLS